MAFHGKEYPIEAVLRNVASAVASGKSTILSAPPGAGKTSIVPLALINEPFLAGKKIIMLEPRRLAARRAAEYMSQLLGERLGVTVGYRIRNESVVGPNTRIEVVTEGVLTRLLHADAALPGVGLVIFDEFHERSIHADVGLALTLDVQEHLRDDLRVLIMSATLDVASITSILPEAIIVRSSGAGYPIETKYASFESDTALERRVTDTIIRALNASEGDILVFLPGLKEIRRTESELLGKHLPEDVIIHLLYGDAPKQAQDAALSPDPRGKRKIILSTNVAETSLTIDGIRIVVDSGYVRASRFDPRRGMSGLVTLPVSQANADQRRGRAGRQGPGVCFRLWTEAKHHELPAHPQPEIKQADLASLALDLARWNDPFGERLRFIDAPPPAHLEQAHALLKFLGALDEKNRLTPHGRAMSDLPVHPRFAHMIIKGKELRAGAEACDLAALLEERDVFAGTADADINLVDRWHHLRGNRGKSDVFRRRIAEQSERLRKLAGTYRDSGSEEHLGILLALAYPDRIGRRIPDRKHAFKLSGGSIGVLPSRSLLSREEFLAVAETDGGGSEVRIFLAAPIVKKNLESVFADIINEETEVRWNEKDERVVARQVSKLGSLILSEHPVDAGDAGMAAMLEGIKSMGLSSLPWTKESLSLRQRLNWARTNTAEAADLPDVSDDALSARLDEWLAPHLHGIRSRADLSRLDMLLIMRSLLSQRALSLIDRIAPSHLPLPSGTRAALDYSAGKHPVLAVRLQELFGSTETPRVARGTIPVLIHLLSPARRPLSVTQDLRSFWTDTYPSLRAQLRARYPKHVWPENPLNAQPTNKTKRGKRLHE